MDTRLHAISDADKLFYYLFSDEESCSVFLELSLCRKVNGASLKEALRKTLRRFPNFRQRPVLDGAGHLFTVDHAEDAEVYPYDPDCCDFATTDTKGFLFRVMYTDRKVMVSVFHAVCDGMGLYLFARTLLYHYFRLEGHEIAFREGDILTEEMPPDPSETADPFTLYPEVNASARPAFQMTNHERVFRLPETRGNARGNAIHRRYRFVLDAEKLLSLSRRAETTLDAYFNLLVARTIHTHYDTQGLLVTEIGAVDLRPFYGSRYLQNMRELFFVPFLDSYFSLEEKEALHNIRDGIMKAQLKKSHYDGVLYANKESWGRMFSFPASDAAALGSLRDGLWSDPGYHVSFFTTNMGRFDPHGMFDSLLREAEITAPCIFPHPSFFVVTQGGKTMVNLVQRHGNKKLPLLLRKVFSSRGLLMEYRECGWFESDKLRLRSLPVLS